MWIDTPDELQRISDPESGEIIDVSGSGATQVPQEIGESLVNEYSGITEHES